jgi:hypothetical protein
MPVLAASQQVLQKLVAQQRPPAKRRSWLACRRFFALFADHSAASFPNQRETLFFPSSQRFVRSLAILPQPLSSPLTKESISA